jgi:uncharacterized membrane-anchored protein
MNRLQRSHWILLVLFLQVLALGLVAAKREWIHNTGTVVYLRTAPVDPRDLFRGDYVQLEYDITQPVASLLNKPWLQTEALQKKTYLPVYLQLHTDARGIANLVSIEKAAPEGLYIKGQVNTQWNDWDVNTFIKLGIEKYFVEQGKGLALEEQMGRAQDWQTPLEMEVAIGKDGTAVIRGHRWSSMSVRLEVLEPGQNPDNTTMDANAANADARAQRRSPKLRISVRNDAQQPVVFVDSASHCALMLVENELQPVGSGENLKPVVTPGRHCNNTVDWQEHVLQPAQVYAMEIDMATPEWQVDIDNTTQEIGMFSDRWSGFRWIYQLPDTEVQSRSGRNDVWLSTLRTARFNANGRID